MKQHFWDMDLSQIPLGWMNILQDAIQSCPNGEYVIDENTNETNWYDPVGCKSKIEVEFHNLKTQAQNLYSKIQQADENIDKTVTNLLKIDIILENIIEFWINGDKYISNFDSNQIIKQIRYIDSEANGYFLSKTEELEHMRPYHKYKFIQLNLL